MTVAMVPQVADATPDQTVIRRLVKHLDLGQLAGIMQLPELPAWAALDVLAEVENRARKGVR
jgi:hypothetical protein